MMITRHSEDWDRADLVDVAGAIMLDRFEQSGNIDEIHNAISASQRAVHLTTDGHAEMPGRLNNLGNTFLRRFERTGDLTDIANAMSAHQRAVQLTPDGHADMPNRLNSLAASFVRRFKRTGALTDIADAISALQRAVQLSPDGHARMPTWLCNLGSSFSARFARTGDITDIVNAISAQQRAVRLTPDGHANMTVRLNSLGNSFLCRFDHTGDLTDIADAISAHQRAVQLTPVGHADMPTFLSNLGNSFLCRFKCTGDLGDIANAISAHQRVVQLTPNDHADMANRLSHLGSSFGCRFERTGDLSDIANAISAHQRAVQLTPNDHAGTATQLSHLGNSFGCRFGRTGDLTDIANAISAHQRAVQLTPDGHAQMAIWLGNLGRSFSCRFERTGDLTDIANAISAHQRAFQLTPDGHAEIPAQLDSLGGSFLGRFERTGDLSDIANAISAHQRAVQLTPNGHASTPNRLSHLGNSFVRRFERTGDLTDIANAISAHQRAVQLTPDGHAQMPIWLSGLGNSFLLRFERTGDLSDIANAISAHQRAVQLTPDGHAKMPIFLSSLGRSFLRRFERTCDLTDIVNAISTNQRSVQLTPNGHVNMSILLANLGDSFSHRFLRTGDFSDTLAATSNYRQSATCKSGNPSARLISAQRWADHLSISHNPIDYLNAYDVVVNLLSQIAGMDRTIEQRHSSLIDISKLTATAASAAFALGEVAKALEWLEQGRCLVWSQLNQLRTPVDDLKTNNPLLADRFLHVSQALESSGSRQESTSLALNGTVSQKIALEDQARTHVKLAQDWEQLLKEIRTIPAFHDFLQPRRALDIMNHLPQDGPVILINVHKDRCDALALIPDCGQPLHIPLDDFTYEEASRLRDRLRSYLSRRGCRMRDVDRGPREVADPEATSEIHNILHDLWMCVAKPVLDALAYSVSLMFMPIIAYRTSFLSYNQPNPSNPTRLWWCATGPLAFLPIHAAGIYGQDIQSPGSCVSDYVVSSYTPTISVLLEKVKASSAGQRSPSSKVLFVSQPHTPNLPSIPGTTREINVVSKKLAIGAETCKSLHLEGSAATVSRVRQEMETHGWVHLACHASQDTHSPLRSGFFLHDGRLELLELMKLKVPQCQLAFLSACQTSTGDETLSEEAVHLAAGMLAVGYQGVVATMWSIKDTYAPEVAGDFYEYLVEKGKNEGSMQLESANAAHALHHATQRLRMEIGDTEDALLTWVPYVHFGL